MKQITLRVDEIRADGATFWIVGPDGEDLVVCHEEGHALNCSHETLLLLAARLGAQIQASENPVWPMPSAPTPAPPPQPPEDEPPPPPKKPERCAKCGAPPDGEIDGEMLCGTCARYTAGARKASR